MRELVHRVAVVTGAASGIGRATAIRLGRAGMRVVIADVCAEPLSDVARELCALGVENRSVRTDVADPESVAALRDAAVEAFGAVHVIHNNAGVALPPMPVWAVTPELWEWILGVNLVGVINGIHTFVPLFVEQNEGHVVNTASLGGLHTGPRLGAYSTTKHAVVALSEILAADLARANADVGVSVVCPSAVPTNLSDSSANNWPRGVPRPSSQEPRNDGSVRFTVVSAEAIADMIYAAIVDDRLHVMTHPETRELIEPRFRRILDVCQSDTP